MPPNTVYVGRPTKWGNPFKMKDDNLRERGRVLRLYRIWLINELRKDPKFLALLKGKDLACWCPLDKLCHADILIKFLEQGKYGEAPKETEEWLKQAMHDYGLTREEAEKWYNDEDALNL